MLLFQGVHTSPKGHVSSSGFVFGENLAERVEIKASKSTEEVESSEGKNGVSSPDTTNSVEHSNSGDKMEYVAFSVFL